MEMNRELAGLFGDCWHEYGPSIRSHGRNYYAICGICEERTASVPHGSLQRERDKNPDYLTLVTVLCDGCGGSGRTQDCKCPPYYECDDPCPTCQGRKTRTISKLQHRMEELGWWAPFVCTIVGYALRINNPTSIDHVVDTLTDLQALGAKVIEWRKS